MTSETLNWVLLSVIVLALLVVAFYLIKNNVSIEVRRRQAVDEVTPQEVEEFNRNSPLPVDPAHLPFRTNYQPFPGAPTYCHCHKRSFTLGEPLTVWTLPDGAGVYFFCDEPR